jgi:ATP phosphoribosyltransferase
VAFSQGAVSQRDLDFAQARALQQGEAKVQVAVPEESTFRKIFARKAKRGRTEM